MRMKWIGQGRVSLDVCVEITSLLFTRRHLFDFIPSTVLSSLSALLSYALIRNMSMTLFALSLSITVIIARQPFSLVLCI